ncbi:MAG: MotA/TolQ/ExbB proton channel family protein [Puniceicoccaceae bacterium]
MLSPEFPIVLAEPAIASLVTYFGQSNTAGKLIIVLLAGGSLFAWTLMLSKYFELTLRRRANQAYEQRLVDVGRLLNLDVRSPAGGTGPYAGLVAAALQSYYRIKATGEVALNARLKHVENALQREVAAHSEILENHMITLASIVTGAPFLGLLGTVWGVMDAFGGVALAGNATIQSLAPGVSGALLTTVAGLVVAIPSVFGYNLLLARVKKMTTELENFASVIADRIELEAVAEED